MSLEKQTILFEIENFDFSMTQTDGITRQDSMNRTIDPPVYFETLTGSPSPNR